MRPRGNPCAFFHKLYDVYWKQNPDRLTTDEFIANLSPALINNCHNLDLLIDMFQMKIDMSYKTYDLIDERNLYEHYQRTNNFYSAPSNMTERLKYIADVLPKMENVKSALTNIKKTKKMTPEQEELLTSMTDFDPPKNSAPGTIPRTTLLFKRLVQLCNELTHSTDNKMRMAGAM